MTYQGYFLIVVVVVVVCIECIFKDKIVDRFIFLDDMLLVVIFFFFLYKQGLLIFLLLFKLFILCERDYIYFNIIYVLKHIMDLQTSFFNNALFNKFFF